MNAKPTPRVNGHPGGRSGFTLIELLVVIAILAVLAGLLLPALAKAKARGQSIACTGSLRQFQLAWQNYTDENQEVMPMNWVETVGDHWRSLPGSWTLGNLRADADLTNLTAGTLYHYVRNVKLYRCPGDRTMTSLPEGRKTPVIRSYASFDPLHTRGVYAKTVAPSPLMQFSECVKVSAIKIPGPDQVWGFIEPNEGSHAYASWGFYLDGLHRNWAHLPTDRHSMGANLSFLDGHVERYRWKDAKEKRPTLDPIRSAADREDYNRLLAGYPRKR